VVLRRVMPCWDTRRLFERLKMPWHELERRAN
jgi:hypothetical protein